MVIGTSLEEMVTAANRVIAIGGGIAIARGSQIVADLRLPVGGLISDEKSGAEMAEASARLAEIASNQLGCELHEPFMHLSFLALTTSPKWKITDLGIVDVNEFKLLGPLDS